MLNNRLLLRLIAVCAFAAVLAIPTPSRGEESGSSSGDSSGEHAAVAAATRVPATTPTATGAAGAAAPQSPAEVYNWSRNELWQEHYDALEKAANQWRDSKEAYGNGDWKLTAFYDGIAAIPIKPEESKKQFNNVREWVKQMPDSITASIALAAMLKSYAWQARGSGRIDTVTEEGYDLFQARLTEARGVLREAKKLKAKCPHWWAVTQDIAMGQSWPLDAYDGLYKEAIKFEPDYFPYYSQKLFLLLPRWRGERGDSEEFALAAANRMGGEKGDVLYARLMKQFFLDEGHLHDEVEVSFEKLDKGLTILDKKHPDNVDLKSMWARFCRITGTPENEATRRKRAARLLKEIEALLPPNETPLVLGLKDLRAWLAAK